MACAGSQGESAETSHVPRCAWSRWIPAIPTRGACARLALLERRAVALDRAYPARRTRRHRRTASPTERRPDQAVPVTTVPTPATENARSTGKRNRSAARWGLSVAA